MKKSYLFIFNILFAIALAIVSLVCVSVSNTPTYAAPATTPPTETKRETIFDFVTISQDGHIIKEEDFTSTTINNTPYDAFYTNKTITIRSDYVYKSIYDNFSISVNSEYLTEPDYIINEKEYYVFDVTSLSEDTATRITLKLEIYNQATPQNPIGYMSTYEKTFMLIQTKTQFDNNSNFYWTYKYTNVLETVKAPIKDCTYPPITLTIPNGSELNPIFVKFVYCGETFEVYNIDGVFYNALNNTQLDFSKLEFDLSGTYSVEIYDKTYGAYEDADYLNYNFIVKNTTDIYAPFYIHAHLEDNSLIMNKQTTNNNTIVEFVNLSDVIRYIDRIRVTRTYKPTAGTNIPQVTEYKGNIPNYITFTEDGIYDIEVIGTNNGNIIKRFNFQIIKSIQTYYNNGEFEYDATDKPANTEVSYTVPQSVTSEYNLIKGISEYSFNVIIARSEPSIDGINNNARTQSNVSLVVRGVGTLKVSITQDSKTNDIEVKNGTRLQTFTEPGKYFVRITDEMGTTVTKSFTINIKMNAASIILIVIAAVIVLLTIIFIIASRAKVKVR